LPPDFGRHHKKKNNQDYEQKKENTNRARGPEKGRVQARNPPNRVRENMIKAGWWSWTPSRPA
jgi:hypothetical protein